MYVASTPTGIMIEFRRFSARVISSNYASESRSNTPHIFATAAGVKELEFIVVIQPANHTRALFNGLQVGPLRMIAVFPHRLLLPGGQSLDRSNVTIRECGQNSLLGSHGINFKRTLFVNCSTSRPMIHHACRSTFVLHRPFDPTCDIVNVPLFEVGERITTHSYSSHMTPRTRSSSWSE